MTPQDFLQSENIATVHNEVAGKCMPKHMSQLPFGQYQFRDLYAISKSLISGLEQPLSFTVFCMVRHLAEPLPTPEYTDDFWMLYAGDSLIAEWFTPKDPQ
ncbi:hypothetical protein SAMN04515617_117109 [Collimonas sp. OK242]|jgi:hypothetical protein|uniref:hypothetical protein n=1 Tax=Collimonas sp. OK242 TaxID=1798195 RepID=UPI00089CE76C|nr:hypothetical protein SAMN04515617_117109 [Collimonas sp. OK242]